MASLVLTIGQITGSVTAADAKAAALLNQYADAIGATGTNAQKADAVVRALVRHMQDQAQRQRGNTLRAEAIAAAQTELDGLTWA
jgi:hypothetical protein